ncbi:MAG: preprotein translocase subunit SecG [Candidatus Omnitrophica bacterium]|nr:preprotein translocase subunit SecG [Candidatus Omnitrophota bacterium]
MTAFIVIVHVIVCFILILVILLQAGRGSGLSWGSFGGTPQSFLGTKSTSILAKATSISAIIFLVTCISLNILETKKSRSLFSGPQGGTVDVEKIKKVLDQIKTEGTESKPETSATAPAVNADKPVQDQAPEAVESTEKTPPQPSTTSKS